VLVTWQGWAVAASDVTQTRCLLEHLRPNTSYMFLVRARNRHGLSLPSPVSDVITTSGLSLSLSLSLNVFDALVT